MLSENPTYESLRRSFDWAGVFDRLGTTPDVVAARVVKAIEYNSPRVLITKETRVADALKRLMPATTDGIVARVFKRVTPKSS